MKYLLNLTYCTTMMIVMTSSLLLAQTPNHLDVEGDAWVKDKLEINFLNSNGGEYIWNPSGMDLRFFTDSIERMRVNGVLHGGDVMIFQMDTISSNQDSTAGNVVRLSDGTLAIRQYKIGDMAHGGMVFWVDETGEHGLVSSLEDIVTVASSSALNFTHVWNSSGNTTGATGDGIGAGAMNTMLNISVDPTTTDSAARLCADLVEGGYADWYLPSEYELNEMYTKIGQGAVAPNTNIGNFSTDRYWSSTEASSIDARVQFFNSGSKLNSRKNYRSRVRAVRAF